MLEQKTAGQKILDNLKNPETGEVRVVDLAQAMTENYMTKLCDAIDAQCQSTKDDFYIEVLQKHERHMGTVFRPHMMVVHSACPAPFPDQTVFRYNQSKGAIELIWVLPPEDAIVMLLENWKDVVPAEQALLNFCAMYARGQLWDLMKKFNGEQLDSSLLENKTIII